MAGSTVSILLVVIGCITLIAIQMISTNAVTNIAYCDYMFNTVILYCIQWIQWWYIECSDYSSVTVDRLLLQYY